MARQTMAQLRSQLEKEIVKAKEDLDKEVGRVSNLGRDLRNVREDLEASRKKANAADASAKKSNEQLAKGQQAIEQHLQVKYESGTFRNCTYVPGAVEAVPEEQSEEVGFLRYLFSLLSN